MRKMFKGHGFVKVGEENEVNRIAYMLTGPFSYAGCEGVREDGAFNISIEHESADFDDESARHVLAKEAPGVISGMIQMTGPDGSMWRYRFNEGHWIREEGTVIWQPESGDGCRMYVLLGTPNTEKRRGPARTPARVLGVYPDRESAQAELDRLDFEEHVRAFLGSGRDWDYEITETGLKA